MYLSKLSIPKTTSYNEVREFALGHGCKSALMYEDYSNSTYWFYSESYDCLLELTDQIVQDYNKAVELISEL